MELYTIVTAVFVILIPLAITYMVIEALNKKGDVSASFRLRQLGFSLTAKEKSSDIMKAPLLKIEDRPASRGLPRRQETD